MTGPARFLAALVLLCGLSVLACGAARAVEPSEMLKDPVLEQRARDLSSQLRCLVCQNESIDNSNAELAHDLRVLVRQRLKAGDSDRQVLDYVVDRYGEFVLLKPRFNLRNAVLWATPVIVLLAGALLAFLTIRRRPRRTARPLDSEEEERLKSLLEKGS